MSGQDYDDLRGFDLSRLDLDHIELDIDRPPSPVWRWVVGFLLAGIAAAVAMAGSRISLSNAGASFGLSLAAVVVGIGLGRWLWNAALARAASINPADIAEEPKGPASALTRWVTFLFGAGGAVTVVALARNGTLEQWFGPGALFGAAAIAIVSGIILGRWLMMQGEAARHERENEFLFDDEREPIELPPWFKWVSLAGIVVIGGGVALWSALGLGEEQVASLGGLGFACGIAAAIWLARRFDELEAQKSPVRARPRERRGQPLREQLTPPPQPEPLQQLLPEDSQSVRNIRHLPVGKSRWDGPQR